VALRPDLLQSLPLRLLYNLLVAPLLPRQKTCSWCHARLTPRAQASYQWDPFLHSTPHSRNGVSLRLDAASRRPDQSTAKWRPEDSDVVLRYLGQRDGARCGRCAGHLPVRAGQIDYVVPKELGLFDFSGDGRAVPGTTFESKLHHIDNLQAVHDYCHRKKGHSPFGRDWRHPDLPSLPVASCTDGSRDYHWLPLTDWQPGTSTPGRYAAVAPPVEPPGDARIASAPAGEGRGKFRLLRYSRWRGSLTAALLMLAAGLMLMFGLMWGLGRFGGDDPPAGAEEGSVSATPTGPVPEGEPRSALPAPQEPSSASPGARRGDPATDAATSPDPAALPESDDAERVAGDAHPVPTVPTTLADRPEVLLTEPPQGWTPTVTGNASSHGEPDRDDLQWVAWQPDCSSCEEGVTLTWVGSYAHPVSRLGPLLSRPKLQSACLHRVRSGPLIDWNRDIGDDRIEALWVDGESVQPGSWWIGGSERDIMAPEPVPFRELLQDARELRVLTANGHDATFAVAGFLTTPVQANLEHCGHYP
jgi:hypothetical protein